jgi:tRNA 2-thiocytidine biosynthesis protein TtcA
MDSPTAAAKPSGKSSTWPSASKRLARMLGSTIVDYQLIAPGDHIMVAVSGGKDSYTLLELLERLRLRAPIEFRLTAVHLDQVQPGYDGSKLRSWLASFGVPYEILREDTYSTVVEVTAEGKAFCAACSRLRRGVLYTNAERLGCNKIALGHHRDDAIETLLMNLFYTGRLQAMPAKYTTDDGRFEVIRPLIECGEADIAAFAAAQAFPIIPCNLCGSQDNLQRQVVKEMLREWEKKHPGRLETMFASLQRVSPSHLLDPKQFDFLGLKTQAETYVDGDIAFDEEDFSAKLIQLPLTRKAENS